MNELLGRLTLLFFRASSCLFSIDLFTFSKTSTTGTFKHNWLKGAEMDASPTASVLDFFVLRLGLGELDPCERSDGEPSAGMC